MFEDRAESFGHFGGRGGGSWWIKIIEVIGIRRGRGGVGGNLRPLRPFFRGKRAGVGAGVGGGRCRGPTSNRAGGD